MDEPSIDLVVTLLVGGFALAFVRDAWSTLRGASAPTAHWIDASRAAGCRGRRPGAGTL